MVTLALLVAAEPRELRAESIGRLIHATGSTHRHVIALRATGDRNHERLPTIPKILSNVSNAKTGHAAMLTIATSASTTAARHRYGCKSVHFTTAPTRYIHKIQCISFSLLVSGQSRRLRDG